MTTVKDIYDYIDSCAPFSTQEEWDNAGLITGSFNAAVTRCVMCLDVTAAAVKAAVDGDAQLILSHHPLIFSPLKRLEVGTAIYSCAQNGISVISAHTNFDRAANGINRNLCKLLDLRDAAPVENTFIWTGSLDTPMSAADFAAFVSERLGSRTLRYTNSSKLIKTAAVGGGACEEFLPQATELADCFVTGDTKYHIMLEAAESDYCLIGAGHYETEHMPFMMLKDELEKAFSDVEFISAQQENCVSAVV